MTCAGPARARRGAEMSDAGDSHATARSLVAGGAHRRRSAPDAELLARASAMPTSSTARGGVLTPGLRRLAHARHLRPRRGTRSRSCAPPASATWRSRGAAAASTRRCATSARAREDELVALALPRLARLASYGVDHRRGEVRLRTLARRRAQDAARHPPPRRERCRCASCRPSSARTRSRSSTARRRRTREEYVALVIDEMIPRGRRASGSRASPTSSARPGVYTVDETRAHSRRRARRRAAAQAARRRARARRGGAELAAELGATSADHLAAISDAGIAALAPRSARSRRCSRGRCSSSARPSRRRRAR